jgi:hypothetical protein
VLTGKTVLTLKDTIQAYLVTMLDHRNYVLGAQKPVRTPLAPHLIRPIRPYCLGNGISNTPLLISLLDTSCPPTIESSRPDPAQRWRTTQRQGQIAS